jgi:hypothetical protein
VTEAGQEIKQFGPWRIARGAKRKDGTQPWTATKDNVILIEDTWPQLKDRIQDRGTR